MYEEVKHYATAAVMIEMRDHPRPGGLWNQ